MDKEIVESFRSESMTLLKELKTIVEKLDEDHEKYPAHLMSEFSQKIDRIMGAAQTLEMVVGEHIGLKAIGTITSNCKKLGQQATALQKNEFVPVVAAFWDETIDVLIELVASLEDPKRSREVVEKSFKTLQKRLDWLNAQVARFVSPEDLDLALKKMGLR